MVFFSDISLITKVCIQNVGLCHTVNRTSKPRLYIESVLLKTRHFHIKLSNFEITVIIIEVRL